MWLSLSQIQVVKTSKIIQRRKPEKICRGFAIYHLTKKENQVALVGKISYAKDSIALKEREDLCELETIASLIEIELPEQKLLLNIIPAWIFQK